MMIFPPDYPYYFYLQDYTHFVEYWDLFECDLKANGCFATVELVNEEMDGVVSPREEAYVQDLISKTLNPKYVETMKRLTGVKSAGVSTLVALKKESNNYPTPDDYDRVEEMRESMEYYGRLLNYYNDTRYYLQRYEKLVDQIKENPRLAILLPEREIMRHCLSKFMGHKRNKYLSKKMERRCMYGFPTFEDLKKQILMLVEHHDRNRRLGFGIVWESLVCAF
ncbi:unnamed protein product [Ambrosiozyma monospora]|uniref:Unnamed protein product n=1 Tax=Ambrosiozyma monospora TaxID=43982 RepID=A0ACB5SUI3_AMBMO|nr:unnamed protein product [Ambrosiozyma monospora]